MQKCAYFVLTVLRFLAVIRNSLQKTLSTPIQLFAVSCSCSQNISSPRKRPCYLLWEQERRFKSNLYHDVRSLHKISRHPRPNLCSRVTTKMTTIHIANLRLVAVSCDSASFPNFRFCSGLQRPAAGCRSARTCPTSRGSLVRVQYRPP